MQIFIYIVIISFLVRTIRNIFYQTFLWQLKEYRIDRLWTHLSTEQGRKLILGPVTLIKWILLIFIIGSIITVNLSFLGLFAYFTFGIIWILEAAIYIRELISRGWRIPRLTLKIIIILGLSFTFQFGQLISGNLIDELFTGPFLDKLLAPSIALFIILANIPSSIFKKIIIILARKKISQFKNLEVIGITGSYGKTSTKEFLATILSEKFKVAKTPEFTNTDIGVAKYIMQELMPDHEVFLAEMGAYKKGEIEAICNMVRPKMGIITGINEQHLELFGSIENTKKAKFELIESLPQQGTAIFNGDNSYCLQMAQWSKKRGLKTFIYNKTRDVKNIMVFKDHIEFTFVAANKKYKFSVNLLGKQTIENLLAAIYAAKSLGLTVEAIKNGLAGIIPTPKTMQLAGKLNGMTLADDTFNANPDGVMAALNYMKIYKGKKILVLTPLIELGNDADKIHKNLGKKAAQVCDLILLTNLNYNKPFLEGANASSGSKKVQIVNTVVGIRLIRQNIDRDGIVVFEGKEAGKMLDKLLSFERVPM
ncbi:UDP-N-acetylmuramoyl-tripeptide--D-alanyl-D-alanine ligase [Candidatus Gottesmanbacteria bacterium]|nr:UDP-N-acetylmuramoyl-tripeptide--D-alanyl-D-alanine ligase [Candidatus Gottesmanbacteria bacterium]